MNAEQEAQRILEEVGHHKVRRALTEVASRLDPEESYRPLLDRAYELGFRAQWDGGVALNTPVQIGNAPGDVYEVIDVDQALTDDEALALGHIDLDTYQGGRSSLEVGREADLAVEQEADASATKMIGSQVQADEDVFWNYGWATLSGAGFNKGVWAWTQGIYNTGNVTMRRHGVRGRPRTANWGGRCFYRPPNDTASYWSRWRMNPEGWPWITWAAFD